MAKYLISYKPEQWFALNVYDSIYTLTIETRLLFGLVKFQKEITYAIPFTANIEKYTKHWDKIIETKSKIKNL